MIRAILFSFLALVMPAAANPADGSWSNYEFNYDTTVEIQSEGGAFCDPSFQACVWNPTLVPGEWTWVNRCLWDGDDTERWMFSGLIAPGESVSITRCLIADWDEKISYVDTGDSGLTATVSVGSQQISGQHKACILGPDYDAGGASIPTVTGSGNGGPDGRGVFTDVTFTVTNNTRHTIRHEAASAKVGIYISNWQEVENCNLGSRFGFNPAWQMGSS